MKRLLWIVIVAVCLIGGPVILLRGLVPLPDARDLEVVTGRVVAFGTTERSFSIQGPRSLALRLDRSQTIYSYPRWFPDTEQLATRIFVGDVVLLHVETGSRKWIWQLVKDGETVVPYESVRSAVLRRRLADLVGGGAMLLTAMIGMWSLRPRPVRLPAPR